MNVEGIWSLRLVPPCGLRLPEESGGFIVFHGGRVLGGDSWVYYTGNYRIHGERLDFHLTSRVHRAGGGRSILGGPPRNLFFDGEAFLVGELKEFGATLTVNGIPDLALVARLSFEHALEIQDTRADYEIPSLAHA